MRWSGHRQVRKPFLRRVDLFLLIVHLLLLGVSLCLLRIGSGCLSGVNHALISGGSLHIPGGGNGFPGFVELLLLVSNIAAVLFDIIFCFLSQHRKVGRRSSERCWR